MPDQRVAVIDGLRGIAILAVLYQHLFVQPIVRLLGAGKNGYSWLLQFGWMGVGLFFILSGFVLALPYWQKRRNFATGLDALEFYRRRIWRLAPLFIVASCVAYFLDARISVSMLILDLSTLNTFTKAEFIPSANGVFWSIDLEIWFSILFPAILIALIRWPKATIAAVFLAALTTRGFGTVLYPDERINFLKDSVVGRLDDFLVGVLIAKLYVERHLETDCAGLIFCAGVAAIALTQLGWDVSEQRLIPAPAPVLLHTAWQIGFGLMIWGALYSQGALRAVLRSLPLRICGIMCFSIYAWHFMLMSDEVKADPFGMKGVAYLATLAAVSLFSFLLFERPVSTLVSYRRHQHIFNSKSGR